MVTKKIDQLLAELSGLYEKDPEKFEEISKKIFNTFIESLPKERQKRARGIQFQIDTELSRYKDPVVRMNRMVELFWKQFANFHGVLHDPTPFMKDRKGKKAQVIPLKPKK